MHRLRLTLLHAALASALLFALWIVYSLIWGGAGILDLIGWALLYLIGLSWASFVVEQAAHRIEVRSALAHTPDARRKWNPFDPASRYYGLWPSILGFLLLSGLAIGATVWVIVGSPKPSTAGWLKNLAVVAGLFAMLALAAVVAQSSRLRQTLAMLASYSILFGLVYLLMHLQFGSKSNASPYELPAGGGSDSDRPKAVKVQKVVRKKFVINPYSSVVFNAEVMIDKIDLKLNAETANEYKAGDGSGGFGKGKGKAGGFGSGSASGKYGFVRLKHNDRLWNKNMGVRGDQVFLSELKSRYPEVEIENETSAVDPGQLDTKWTAKKPLPLLYVCGAQGLNLTPAEKQILRRYLVERHGMILGDNHGGGGFHNSFVAAMTEITGVNPVPIPRDDRIHRKRTPIPQLPIVVAHGGTTALGWKIDGRWAVYYHPGALSDAWADDHAGIPKEVYDLCYQLGINILYYAYEEQDAWRQAQQPE